MNVTSKIKMDMTRPDLSLSVNAVQGDAYSRVVSIALYNGPQPWGIPDNVSAAIRYAKPDQTKGYYDTLPDGSSAWSIQENILTVQLAPQMLTVAGAVKMQIELIQEYRLLSTFCLTVFVESNPAAGVLNSEDYINWIQWLQNQAAEQTLQIQQCAETAVQAAQTATVTAEQAVDAAASASSYLEETATLAGEVSAIVAGNEAYTKQESDLRFTNSIIPAVSGTLITVSDSTAAPFQGLRLLGKTTQNGTPTLSVPITLDNAGNNGSIVVQVLGKNILPTEKFPATIVKNGISLVNHGNGSFSISGTASSNTSFSFGWAGDGSKLEQIIRRGGRFVFSCDKAVYHGASFNCTVSYKYDGQPKYITASRIPIEIPVGAEYQSTSIWISAGTTIDTIENAHLQLEIGNAATEYEPYHVQTLPVSTPNGLPGIPVTTLGNYTDESGRQWICDEIDFAKGVYIQRIGRISSYAGEDIPGLYMSTTGALSDGASVLYVTGEETCTALTAENKSLYSALHTSYPSTTIFNDADIWMEGKYRADTKHYIDTQLALLKA